MEFRGFLAVKDVTLSVNEGTVHALIGPNGAGKTTVFNLLTKFLTPTRGAFNFAARTSRVSSPPRSRGSVSCGPFRSPRCFRT